MAGLSGREVSRLSVVVELMTLQFRRARHGERRARQRAVVQRSAEAQSEVAAAGEVEGSFVVCLSEVVRSAAVLSFFFQI